MNARRGAPLALTLLCVIGCNKKTEIREDPPSASVSQTSLASASALPAPASVDDASKTSVTKTRTVKMIETGTDIKGRLPPEIIKRIIRANFPRLRACYEQGLKRDPTLKGTVSVRFIISASGAVESASSAGGTMTDKPVSDCVLGVYRTLSFPEPEGGKVMVTYPIDFQNEESAPGSAQGQPGSGSGMGYGGCPCGCDHSEDMVAELRGLERDAALRAIDGSLQTIGEREDAGYITDRMVRHRLRLLDFGSELGRIGPARFTSIPPIRVGVGGTTVASTKVHAQFIFHGEATELVNGKVKLLRAAFVVRFDLENQGAAEVTLHRPTLDANMPLPVSRWYVAGGDGRHWDGVLPAGTKKLVHVIGLAGEAVQPGTDVVATIHFESMDLHVKARARAHWNQVEP